jgi:hypothetical protein
VNRVACSNPVDISQFCEFVEMGGYERLSSMYMKTAEIIYFLDKSPLAPELYWGEGESPDTGWEWVCERGKMGIPLEYFGFSWDGSLMSLGTDAWPLTTNA